MKISSTRLSIELKGKTTPVLLSAADELIEPPDFNKVVTIEKFSTYNRLVRVTAWVKRFEKQSSKEGIVVG